MCVEPMAQLVKTQGAVQVVPSTTSLEAAGIAVHGYGGWDESVEPLNAVQVARGVLRHFRGKHNAHGLVSSTGPTPNREKRNEVYSMMEA